MLNVACSTAENINLAFYQNAVPIVRELSVGNEFDTPVSGVEVHLSSEPGFVSPGVWRIDKIAPNDVHHLPTVDLKLDSTFLSGLTASRRGEIRVRVEVSGQLLAEKMIEVNLLPPTHWGGAGAAPELMAAFVRPTDPSVDVVLREAAEKLAQAGRDLAIDGYRRQKRRALGRSPRPSGPRSSDTQSLTCCPRRASNVMDSSCAGRATFCRAKSAPAST